LVMILRNVRIANLKKLSPFMRVTPFLYLTPPPLPRQGSKIANPSYPPISYSMATTNSPDPLVWIDCEMTGLDRNHDTIMSISCFITDADLKFLDTDGFDTIIHHEKSALDKMDDWCTKTHGKSGLTAACIASDTKPEVAAASLLDYVKRFVPQARKGLLAGNSVHCDKEFLSKPPYDIVMTHLHYRILDVSSIKEAAKRWAPREVLRDVPKKKGLHQAREDILESIEEARFYQEVFFRPSNR